MNIWKATTIALALGMTVLGGKVITNANAAPAPSPSPAVGYDWAVEQPHMDKALQDLRGARHSLEVAAEHKGGWRVRALQHTDEAINETIKGMEWAKAHPRGE